jgi:hypothetical protein
LSIGVICGQSLLRWIFNATMWSENGTTDGVMRALLAVAEFNVAVFWAVSD